jgi:hypothetical protein
MTLLFQLNMGFAASGASAPVHTGMWDLTTLFSYYTPTLTGDRTTALALGRAAVRAAAPTGGNDINTVYQAYLTPLF